MKHFIFAVLTTTLAACTATGCLRDFDKFRAQDVTATGGEDGRNSSGGNGSGGDSSGGRSNSGGDGGVSGTGGRDDGCSVGSKLCSSECVPVDDPLTGCGSESCSPCPSASHAAVGCNAGECALLSCDTGFRDCDMNAANGCEHSPGGFTETACGGCDADCTSLGFNTCNAGKCSCSQDSECQGNTTRDVSCNTVSRTCECDGDVCNVGETCRKSGPSSVCACGSGSTCGAGQTCCPETSGPTCRDLDANDASNCGACGWQCASDQVCVAGACQ